MKNLFSLLAIAGVMFAATPAAVFALQDQADSTEVVSTEVVSMEGDSAASDTVVAEVADQLLLRSLNQLLILKKRVKC